jgi:hypothetical protein
MNARPVCSKEWLLELCAQVADRPEIAHLHDKDHYEEGLKVIAVGDLDLDETYPDVYGLPDKFRVLFPDTYLKLQFVWQNLVELRDRHQFYDAPHSRLIRAIDGVPLSGLVFEFRPDKYDIKRWEERTKFFHDIIDEAEARIAIMQPDQPIKLKRFPFAFGDWMQVVQTEDGTKSVLVSTGGSLGGDMGTWAEFIMVNPDPATPDQPYPFDEKKSYFHDDREHTVGVNYTWLAGPILADWFASGVVHNRDAVELMDSYINDGEFKAGPRSETMAQIRERFDQEHPPEDDE